MIRELKFILNPFDITLDNIISKKMAISYDDFCHIFLFFYPSFLTSFRNFSTSVEIPSDRWPYIIQHLSYPCYEHVSTTRLPRIIHDIVYISISKFRHYKHGGKRCLDFRSIPARFDPPDAACTSVAHTMANLLTTTSRRAITVAIGVNGFRGGDTVSRIRGENSGIANEASVNATREDQFIRWSAGKMSLMNEHVPFGEVMRVSIFTEETEWKLSDPVFYNWLKNVSAKNTYRNIVE